MKKIKPSVLCKMAGLKNLNEMSETVGRGTQTLIRWYHNDYDFFLIVLAGCAFIRLFGIFRKFR